MADPQSLLQPLRSDSLKPRASAQAVWNTEAAPPSLEEPSFPTLQQSSGRSANAPVPPEIPFAADGDLTLDDVLSSLVPVCIEEEEPVNETDAVPSERMPVPVCVPLFEDLPPQRKPKAWLWLIVIAVLAGGIYAAWHFGYLDAILP